MPDPTPIPDHLIGTSFPSRDAPTLGVSASRLRRAGVQHPFRGVAAVDADLQSIMGRCAAYVPRLLEGQVFSHVTALALLGAPLPDDAEKLIHVSVLYPRTPPRTVGVAGHSLRRQSADVRDGLPVAVPAAAWAQSAALLSLRDLVAVGDYLIRARRIGAIATLAELAACERGYGSRTKRGAAVRLIRQGVDSRPETHLRLALVDAGFVEPVIRHPVPVPGLILHPDLSYPEQRVVLEYEGDEHRVDRRTWQLDLQRRELLEDAGSRVIRVTAADLYGDLRPLAARLVRLGVPRRACASRR